MTDEHVALMCVGALMLVSFAVGQFFARRRARTPVAAYRYFRCGRCAGVGRLPRERRDEINRLSLCDKCEGADNERDFTSQARLKAEFEHDRAVPR